MYCLKPIFKITLMKRLKLYSIALSVFIVLIFDFFISSSSITPFRYIYDVAFFIIVFVTTYVSILLVKNIEFTKNKFILYNLKFYFIFSVLFNLITIFSILWLGEPDIGFLGKDVLKQGISGMLPLLNYLIIVIVNGILLYVAINKNKDIGIYEIPAYIFCIIALEVFLTSYCFHVGGINGIRWGLSIFHGIFCGLAAWLHRKQKITEITLTIGFSEVLLGLLSLGLFIMIYIPFGIYSLLGDNAIVVNSALSIIQRGSLQPFYHSSTYYSPIGGFVSIVFSYICDLNNILLASSLPFITAHIMLPFIIYHFFKSFVIDDPKIAIIITIITVFMDGLAVILLPTYANNLTMQAIMWEISPSTGSLYFSSISILWLVPYKVFGVASSIAMCNMFDRRSATSPILGGALLGLSFVNPRQPFIAILLLVFLFGIKKLDLKDLSIIGLATIIFLGPIFYPIVYKITFALFLNLSNIGLIREEVLMQVNVYLMALVERTFSLVVPLILMSLIAIGFLIRLGLRNNFEANISNEEYVLKRIPTIIRKKGEKIIGSPIPIQDILFLGLSIFTLIYIFLHANKLLLPFNEFLIENMFIAPLNYILLRYHILIVLTIIGFFIVKYNKRTLITFASLAILIYLGILFKPILRAPVIIVILALPIFNTIVKSRKIFSTIVILVFVFLGIFSGSMFSAIVKTPEYESRYSDLGDILEILITVDPNENVYCVSSYDYWVRRTVNMANLQLTSDPSCQLYMIDKAYTKSAAIENLLNDENSKVLYHGDSFILLERTRVRNDLIIDSEVLNTSRVSPSQNITVLSEIYYPDNTTPLGYGNSALNFNGNNDYMNCENNTSLESTSALTVECWFNARTIKTVVNQWDGLINKLTYSDEGYALLIGNNYMISFAISHSTGWKYTNFNTIPQEHVWYHAVAVFNGSSIKVYLNDKLDGETLFNNGTINYPNHIDLQCGVYSTNYFDGIIDEVRIYKRALTTEEIHEHYQGIYYNETGLVLHLNFDGDAEDKSRQGNHGKLYGPTWTNGYKNINLKVESQDVLKNVVSLVNSTSGTLLMPLSAGSNIGQYSYTIFATTLDGNTVENKTFNIIVDRLKVVEGGITQTSINLSASLTVWFKAVYEFDNSSFDETCGILYLNGSAMEWSRNNERWEYKYTPDAPGPKTFKVTGFLDRRYNLTALNDAIDIQRVSVLIHWYDHVIRFFTMQPLYMWTSVGFLIIIVIFFGRGIVRFRIEKVSESSESSAQNSQPI